jgi:hypothetical protein
MKIICWAFLLTLLCLDDMLAARKMKTANPKLKPSLPTLKNNQAFIFIRNPNTWLQRQTEQERAFQLFRLPSIESLPAILDNIVEAKKKNESPGARNRDEINLELPFSPSSLDPVEYKQDTSSAQPAGKRIHQRDTTDIDVPIINKLY